MKKFTEYKNLDLTAVAQNITQFWTENETFKKSVEIREGKPEYVFYEGPPSANGMPGIHHVMARALKDIFCRYQTPVSYTHLDVYKRQVQISPLRS